MPLSGDDSCAKGPHHERTCPKVNSSVVDVPEVCPEGVIQALSDLLQVSSEVKTPMASTEEAARRGGIYPGESRDLRKRYRLEWDGWER